MTKSYVIKIYFLYKYEIYSRKYIFHTSSYPAKYIFLTFSRRKVLYCTYIFFSMRENCVKSREMWLLADVQMYVCVIYIWNLVKHESGQIPLFVRIIINIDFQFNARGSFSFRKIWIIVLKLYKKITYWWRIFDIEFSKGRLQRSGFISVQLWHKTFLKSKYSQSFFYKEATMESHTVSKKELCETDEDTIWQPRFICFLIIQWKYNHYWLIAKLHEQMKSQTQWVFK